MVPQHNSYESRDRSRNVAVGGWVPSGPGREGKGRARRTLRRERDDGGPEARGGAERRGEERGVYRRDEGGFLEGYWRARRGRRCTMG